MYSARLRRVASLALTLALIVSVGCSRERQRAANLNNAASAASKRLEVAGKSFGEAVGKALQSGAPADAAAARQQYTSLQTVVRAARQEMTDMDVSGVSGGSEFKAATLKFFQNQESMMDTDFKEMLDILDKKGMTKAARAKAVLEKMTGAAGKESKDLVEIQAAQRTFAAQHNITLAPPGGQTPVPGS
jgi:hypothetical protein